MTSQVLFCCSVTILPDHVTTFPEQLLSSTDATADLSSALGPNLTVTIGIRNQGPSDSPFSKLIILWPLEDPEQAGRFFLYTQKLESVSREIIICGVTMYACVFTQDSSVSCSMENINPNNIYSRRRKRQSVAASDSPTEVVILLLFIIAGYTYSVYSELFFSTDYTSSI